MNGKKLAVLLLTLLLLVGCSAPQTPVVTGEGLAVHFIDVGQADCTLLQCDGQAMLIDGGNVEDSDLVVSYLQDYGVTKLDLVVNTHAHEDHVGGLAAVLAVYETEELWCPVTSYDTACFEDFSYYADQQRLELTCPDPGDTFFLGEAQVTVLGPVRDDYDTNNSSIVLRVDYGQTSFLFSGDAELEAENDILDMGFDISATVMKAGHHGSSTSNGYRWLREANAAYVVIPVGADNSYGHPHKEILSRFRDADMIVYRTDQQGHIVCQSDGTDVTFTTEKQSAVTNPTELDGSGQNAHGEQFIGNVNSKKLHLPSCNGLPSEKNRVEFTSYDEAVAQGYEPCGNCMG